PYSPPVSRKAIRAREGGAEAMKKTKGKRPAAGAVQKTDLDDLTLLGGQTKPVRKLETFPNHHPGRDYTVSLSTDEFTCICPKTGQPDFAKIRIEYIPDKRIVESKSLKLYLWSFREEGTFHEHVTNVILDDLVKALAPRMCRVTANFAVRGGIAIAVEAEYRK
ncbi:MAG TPA: preQ(1) synthase, partial [Syntrophales bacterium]|nr:preQ(1) synthase [Syntrophales bacterium]